MIRGEPAPPPACRNAVCVVAVFAFRYNPPDTASWGQAASEKQPKQGNLPTNQRIGIGHDTHRLVPGGPLRLGGIDVPHDQHADGHSDADVLLHAITDAILGAAALGDIGEMFPDTEEANRDRDSAEMLRAAYDRVRKASYRVVNLDCIVFAQQPKLSPWKTAIRDRVAAILEIDPTKVGIKAKTGEGVDAVGRREAVAAQCVCLLAVVPDAEELVDHS